MVVGVFVLSAVDIKTPMLTTEMMQRCSSTLAANTSVSSALGIDPTLFTTEILLEVS